MDVKAALYFCYNYIRPRSNLQGPAHGPVWVTFGLTNEGKRLVIGPLLAMVSPEMLDLTGF